MNAISIAVLPAVSELLRRLIEDESFSSGPHLVVPLEIMVPVVISYDVDLAENHEPPVPLTYSSSCKSLERTGEYNSEQKTFEGELCGCGYSYNNIH